MIRPNCEQLLKHSFIRDCQEKPIKLQIKEYLDKTRKGRRSSTVCHQPLHYEIQENVRSKSDDEEEEDEDDDEDDNEDNRAGRHQQFPEHPTQKENNLNTLRQNFKCVQHISPSKSSTTDLVSDRN